MNLTRPDREKKQHIRELSLLLRRHAETELLLLCRDDSDFKHFALEHGLDCLTLTEGSLSRLFLPLKLLWKLRGPGEPWILQSFDQQSLQLALCLASRKKNLKVVYAPLVPEALRIKRLNEKIHLVRAVIAGARALFGAFLPYGFAESSLYAVHSCLDPALYLQRRARADKRVLFACSDSLEPGKGYEQLFKALALLNRNQLLPAWELRIAGGGPLFEPLLEQARALGIDGRLAVFGEEHGADILQDCDILVSPAEAHEGSGLSVREGWACGLPVICSDIPPHLELVTDGLNALCFQNSNPAHLAEQMLRLALDAELRLSLVRAGAESLRSYNGQDMLKKHLDIFRRILDEGPATAA
ncbi:MAG: glycosyltransferase family 4 protein [Deltaproteobacteria bacterium]|nr:glycosyltransferase family 4 protein [Deltaproteobacteria bacterium]